MEEEKINKQLAGRMLARAQAMQVLYESEICNRAPEILLESGDYVLEDGPLDEFADMLIRMTSQHKDEIDNYIILSSKNWGLSRMPIVDRNLLRIAIAEILYVNDVPLAASIDQAVELAKRYGLDESSKFINGVLGRVANEFEAGTWGAQDAADRTVSSRSDGTEIMSAYVEPETETSSEDVDA